MSPSCSRGFEWLVDGGSTAIIWMRRGDSIGPVIKTVKHYWRVFVVSGWRPCCGTRVGFKNGDIVRAKMGSDVVSGSSVT